MGNPSLSAVIYVTERRRRLIERIGYIKPQTEIIPPQELYYALMHVDIPPIGRERGLFAFIRDEIHKWKKHEYLVDLFDKFLRVHYGINQADRVRTLHLEVKPEDGFHVLDWSPVEWDISHKGAVLPENWIAYLNSMVPLAEYKGNYEMPLLVTTNSIPKDRITREEQVSIDELLSK